MRDVLSQSKESQLSQYLRTGRVLPAQPFNQYKSISLSHKSWTTRDFIHHYATGNGRTVNLADIGLLNQFQNSRSVKNAIKAFEMRQMRIAERHANKICQNNHKKTIVSIPFFDEDKTVTDVTQDGALFSVGNSTFYQSSSCVLEVDCYYKVLKLDGILTFEIKDWFRDPLDLDVELPRAKIFKIVAQWSQPMNYIYDRLKMGRWVRD